MKNVYFIILALFSMFLFSCQDEFENENQNLENTITKTSPLATLVSRVSQNRTTFDNIVDGTSCFSLQLPISLTVDSHEVVIQTEADYKNIKAILEESEYDDDVIHLSYPVTLVYRNFKSVTVNNKEDFDTIIKSCSDDQDFEEIDCIKFNYPIAINTYDKNNQIANTITIQSNSQFINLLDNLKINDIICIVYPITMTSSDGEQLSINNNSELTAGIQNAIGACDDDGNTELELSEIVTKGSWHISYFLDEGEDETANFSAYNFIFSEDGKVTATNNSDTTTGSWSTYIEDGKVKLEINFMSNLLEEINGDWIVSQSNATTIYCDDNETNYHIIFSKN